MHDFLPKNFLINSTDHNNIFHKFLIYISNTCNLILCFQIWLVVHLHSWVSQQPHHLEQTGWLVGWLTGSMVGWLNDWFNGWLVSLVKFGLVGVEGWHERFQHEPFLAAHLFKLPALTSPGAPWNRPIPLPNGLPCSLLSESGKNTSFFVSQSPFLWFQNQGGEKPILRMLTGSLFSLRYPEKCPNKKVSINL